MTTLSNPDRQALELAVAVYGPVALSFAAWLRMKATAAESPGVLGPCLLGLLWCVPSLVTLQRLNTAMQWWTFVPTTGINLISMPVELWIGWAVLWGVLPHLALHRLRVVPVAGCMVLADLAFMPMMQATVKLQNTWLIGEAVAVLFVLLPAMALQRLTAGKTHVSIRATLQVLTAGLIFLYLPVEIVAATGGSLNRSFSSTPAHITILLCLLAAVPGLSAVQEFATRGLGTPIPYDPPPRFVTSGVYRYLASPMQAACTLTLLLWALVWRSPMLLAGPVLAAVYSAGLAHNDEGADLQERFGDDWQSYQRSMSAWWPRWRPWCGQRNATLYVAGGCSACQAVRGWLERHSPSGIVVAHAETLPAGTIQRIRYVDSDYTVDGVRAFARALEHLDFRWAMIGAVVRLPPVWWLAQLALDCSGLGPRTLHCVPSAAHGNQ